jgi:hypothetical protein
MEFLLPEKLLNAADIVAYVDIEKSMSTENRIDMENH